MEEIMNQSLASFIEEHFIKTPSISEVRCAVMAELLGIPLVGENLKTGKKKEDKMGKCKDCKWWEARENDENDEDDGGGYCRKYSPKIVEAQVCQEHTQRYADMIVNEWETDAVWPLTSENEWCGEFEAKEMKPSPGAHA